MTWPPKIGSPQWRYQYENFRVFAQILKDKLSDDRQYLADPMLRADDRAVLQHIENSLTIFKLEEERLTNPSPDRILLEGAGVHYLTLPLFFVGTPADVRLDLPASKDSE